MARKWYGSRPYNEYTSSTGGTSTNVAYDATGVGNSVDSGSNTVTITWSHTATGGSNSAVVVALLVGGVSASYSTFTRTVTYDGNSMTPLVAADGNTNGWVEIFYLLNPPAGTKTVSVTVAKSATTFGRVSANSFSYTNVSAVKTGLSSNSIATAATSVVMLSDWSVSTDMAGSKTFAVFGVDGSATITSTAVNVSRHYTSKVLPDMGSSVRWTSNSGTTTGMTSAVSLDAPPTMFTMHGFTMSASARSAFAACQLAPVGTPVPKGISGCYLTMFGAGGGGGSGRRGAAGTARFGGDGGAGGTGIKERFIPVAALGSTYSIYVPPIATGGPAVTGDNLDGNTGVRVPDILFGSGSLTVSGASGHGGSGGSTAVAQSAANGGLLTDPDGSFGGYGGMSSATANASAGNHLVAIQNGNITLTAGGGAGGGISTGNISYNGGAGGDNRTLGIAGGSAGITGGASPGAGSSAILGLAGSGAGGGGAGQNGASAFGYGAGAGGGGASLNGTNSGAGGDGGPAYIRVMWDYR